MQRRFMLDSDARNAGTDAPWFVRVLRLAEDYFWEHWATDAEYRWRFGSCIHRRHPDASTVEQGEAPFVAWLFTVLQWLVYARITGQ